jgi:hypothetical protein
MRLLHFNVDAQKITKAPNCDFDNIVAGTSGYLRAHFTFSPEWNDYIKIAQFWRGEKEYAVLIVNGECDIHPEALVGPTFRVSVLGDRNGCRIVTNRVLVRQEGGR